MIFKINPAFTQAWEQLKNHRTDIRKMHLKNLFEEDHERFRKFSLEWKGILLDYSKNRISSHTMALLNRLAWQVNLHGYIDGMFDGEHLNESEDRAVLHTALRNTASTPVYYKDRNITPDVLEMRDRMKAFSHQVLDGNFTGYTGKRITDVVNIGIGGSDLGPRMAVQALKPYHLKKVKAHFISNVDGTAITDLLADLNPETTLFIVASKSFTTQETMLNAHTARCWFLEHALRDQHIGKHFVAVTTNELKAREFGIQPENIFRFEDWVGGRFSLWSPIGLSIMLSIGPQQFDEFLRGAHEMDEHFKHMPVEKNMPVILALLSIWYTNFLDAKAEAILPYCENLALLPPYLQQLCMESNGKSVDRNHNKIGYQTSPVVWGQPGTNGQHAFFQLLHQGTQMVPADFIAPVNHHSPDEHHEALLANMFAQTRALMLGRDRKQVKAEMKAAGKSEAEIKDLLAFRTFDGNRPSNTILLENLDPYTLGALIALYEHKTFVQGVIWNINSFDQWGVELGKALSKEVLASIRNGEKSVETDQSTGGLLDFYFNRKRPTFEKQIAV